MKHLPYKSYKNSGIEWMGDIPESWVIKKLKFTANIFASNVDKKTVDGQSLVSLCNYTDVYYNEIIKSGMDFMAASATNEQIEKFLLKKNDVIITKDSETPDDIGIAAYVPEDIPGVICGYHLSMIRPKRNNSGAFIKRVFDSHYVKSKFETLANGVTRYGLGSYAIDNLSIPLPPYEEQKAIANFLDRETAKIDELIQKQKELIELSEKRKKQLTLETLTFGVRKNTDTKSSNLPWAPKIPSNWGVYALKRIASMQSGSSITAEHIEEDGLYPVFGGGGFRGYTSEYTHEGIYPLIGRQGALCGNVNFSKDKFWASEHAVVVSPMKNIDPIWLGLLLRSMNLGQYSMSAAQPGLSVDVIKNLLAPIPPYEEQLEISNFLNKEYSKIEALIGNSQLSIKLLSEHRASLISAAVTGKIMVTE